MRLSDTFLQLAKGTLISLWDVAKGYLLPFGSLCMRNPRIACNADHVFQYTAQINQIKIKKWRRHLKFIKPSAILILIKAYPTIPLSGQSNLVRRYL
jgi:hypothetical protein